MRNARVVFGGAAWHLAVGPGTCWLLGTVGLEMLAVVMGE